MRKLLLFLLCLLPLCSFAETFKGKECQTIKPGKSVTIDVVDYLHIWYYVDKSKSDFCWFEVQSTGVGSVALYRVYAMHDDVSIQALVDGEYTTVETGVTTGWHLLVVSPEGLFVDGASLCSGRELSKVRVEVPEYSASVRFNFDE